LNHFFVLGVGVLVKDGHGLEHVGAEGTLGLFGGFLAFLTLRCVGVIPFPGGIKKPFFFNFWQMFAVGVSGQGAHVGKGLAAEDTHNTIF
jgi:hypothetical protein